jgi:hypothetical protein
MLPGVPCGSTEIFVLAQESCQGRSEMCGGDRGELDEWSMWRQACELTLKIQDRSGWTGCA